jgi:hypothetical protein
MPHLHLSPIAIHPPRPAIWIFEDQSYSPVSIPLSISGRLASLMIIADGLREEEEPLLWQMIVSWMDGLPSIHSFFS